MPFKHQIVPAKVSQWFIPVWSNFNENIYVHITLCNIFACPLACSIWFLPAHRRSHISIECHRVCVCDVHVPRSNVLFVDPKLKSMSKFTFYCASFLLTFTTPLHSQCPFTRPRFVQSLAHSSRLNFHSWAVKINICKQTKLSKYMLVLWWFVSTENCSILSSACVCVFVCNITSSLFKTLFALFDLPTYWSVWLRKMWSVCVLFVAQADGHSQCGYSDVLLSFFCLFFLLNKFLWCLLFNVLIE